MTNYIAILRGINVGGKRSILMKDLVTLCEEMGLRNVKTYIQSGNVFFQATKTNKQLEQELSDAISKKYGFDVPVIVRTVEEIKACITNNPFLPNADIEQLHLTFLAEVPSEANLQILKQKANEIAGENNYHMNGQNVYICCAGKYSDSKLSNSFFEKYLKVSATTRNWKTVNKLIKIAH
jgi:uncharacterized protein (DUF1697 family)